MGLTILAMVALGNQPASINRAAIRPQAMKAPMLGMTIPLRNRPNFCTRSFTDLTPFNMYLGKDHLGKDVFVYGVSRL